MQRSLKDYRPQHDRKCDLSYGGCSCTSCIENSRMEGKACSCGLSALLASEVACASVVNERSESSASLPSASAQEHPRDPDPFSHVGSGITPVHCAECGGWLGNFTFAGKARCWKCAQKPLTGSTGGAMMNEKEKDKGGWHCVPARSPECCGDDRDAADLLRQCVRRRMECGW